MVAAIAIGGAVVGAAGSAIAGSEAAGATRDASNAAIAQQQTALQQQAQLSAPYRNLGESAIPTLQGLLGIGQPQGGVSPAGSSNAGQPAGARAPTLGGIGNFDSAHGMIGKGGGRYGYDPSSGKTLGAGGQIGQGIPGGTTGAAPAGTPAATGSADSRTEFLRNTPGYQFEQEQGTLNTVNSASAMGLGLSGNTLEALSKFNQGLADTTYQQELGNYENLVNIGQAAAAGQASNVGNAAANTGNILVNQGNTLAGIDANTAAGITKSVGNASNQYQTLKGLKNPNSGYNPNSDPSAWDTENPSNFQDW